jgi:hypothetical protein
MALVVGVVKAPFVALQQHANPSYAAKERELNRLRTALAIGRQQRSQWPPLAFALAKSRQAPLDCTGSRLILSIGIITAPANADRRRRVRHARDVLLSNAERCSVKITFLLGESSMFTRVERKLVEAERQKHDDMLLLRAHDGAAASAESHGGRAVAEKALAWYIHAANHSGADFVAKVDDDSMVSLPRLVGELRAVSASAPRPDRAHFGVHLYRIWKWNQQATVPNAACGKHSDAGPPANDKPMHRMLTKMSESVLPGGACAGGTGPYLFLDGSFEVLGRGLLTDVFGSARVRSFAAREFERRRAPYWSHEDAGLGALIHREVASRQLPVTYVALRRWEHNRFWLNWADRSTLLDGDVLWAHFTRSAERADYVNGAYAAFAALPPDGLTCGDCSASWGYTAPAPLAVCCSKPKPRRRMMVPRTLRHHYAPDRALNLTCAGVRGAEEMNATSAPMAAPAPAPPKYMLAILSRSHEADERYELRRLLQTEAARERLHTHGVGTLQACFVFDPTPPHGGTRKPGQMFNTRAWLLYEAGRRADFDLSALSPTGDFRSDPRRPKPTQHAWSRAAAHASGPSPAEFYAVTTAEAMLSQSPAGLTLSAFKPSWVVGSRLPSKRALAMG